MFDFSRSDFDGAIARLEVLAAKIAHFDAQRRWASHSMQGRLRCRQSLKATSANSFVRANNWCTRISRLYYMKAGDDPTNIAGLQAKNKSWRAERRQSQ